MRASRIVIVAALAACLSSPGLAADVPAAVAAAVADKARPASDAARDANRKPAEALAFAGIQPGSKIAELIPGGGYFTRLLSSIAGTGGQVYALTGPNRTAIDAIAADAHYGNVTVLPLSFTERALGLPQSVDVVWTSNNYHDVRNAQGGVGMKNFNQRVFEALKSGGIYIVIDHTAAAGRGDDDSRTLHRIDPETVKADVIAAGFTLAGSSDVLRNPDDPRTATVYDASIRGRTDQFILKFVKP
jgi:predicted methyltransferase